MALPTIPSVLFTRPIPKEIVFSLLSSGNMQICCSISRTKQQCGSFGRTTSTKRAHECGDSLQLLSGKAQISCSISLSEQQCGSFGQTSSTKGAHDRRESSVYCYQATHIFSVASHFPNSGVAVIGKPLAISACSISIYHTLSRQASIKMKVHVSFSKVLRLKI
jgi:hypothetical protein